MATDGFEIAPREFERTVCACTACTRFCFNMPGMLIPSDLFRIGDHLRDSGVIATTRDVFQFLRASKGAVVGNTETQKLYRIGTITPKVENGRCVFLNEENRCKIHAVSPFGCAYFSDHDDRVAADVRSLWALRLIASTPAYEQLRQIFIERDGGAKGDPIQSRIEQEENEAAEDDA